MNDRLTILRGDCRETLPLLPDASVQCCVTSPPYWGLRDYGHTDQIGQEATPELYVATMLNVFSEVHRVLRDDGTLWLNLGDSYFGSWGNYGGQNRGQGTQREIVNGSQVENPAYDGKERMRPPTAGAHSTLKPKDLCGIPWRVAFALQAAGWYLRQDIIWSKPNCMPESVTDRCTKSHEYIFLLTKSPKYYYDAEAIKEPATEHDWEDRLGRANLNNKLLPTELVNGIRPRDTVKYTPNGKVRGHPREHEGNLDVGTKQEQCAGMRNKRSVWTVSPASFPEAHFATFPPDLIKPCILAGSRTGDTILDPFGGSGTTGMVSLEYGRRAILCELNPDYVAIAQRRCDVTPGLAL